MLCHLITVGTSLEGSSDQALREIVKEALANPGTQPWQTVVGYLLGLDGDLCVRDRQHDPLCQELSYLHLDYLHRAQGPHQDDRVVLLTSDTDKGRACALILRDYVSKARFSGAGLHYCEVVTLRGLDPGAGRLGEEALDCLARQVDEAVRSWGDTHEIILNISGGFKGLIPYATFLAAMYPQVQLRYLYQHATAPVVIPTLPVSFDAAAWRDWRSLIKSVDGMAPGEARRSLVAALPTSLRPLFTAEGDLGFLGRALSHRFQDERVAQLNLHGQGDQLLALLKGEHRQRVEEQLPIWRHSTVGDKVPEMVDHGRGHLQRVQELLAQVLIPLEHDHPNFFHQEEYLALIGTLWLHDSGHAAEYLSLPLARPFQDLCQPASLRLPTAGFPSLSRDLHQLLIGSLLLNSDTRPAYLPVSDFWSDERVAAMLWVCLYHRRSMPLADGRFCFGSTENPLLTVSQVCPEDCLVHGTRVRVRLLAALYSLCDGCDIQSERAASDEELFARRHQLQRSVKALLEQAELAVRGGSGPEDVRSILRQFVDHRVEILAYCLTGSGAVECVLDQLEKSSTLALHAFLRRTYFADARPGLEETTVVSMLDRLQFLARQSGFYTHHRGVQAVYVVYLGDKQFRVCASGDAERMRKIVLGGSQGKKGSFAGELERSGPVLREHGLQIHIDEESLVEL